MNPDRRDIDAVLAALADPTRRQLLDVLAQLGLASATTLAARLPVSRQAVVKHLRILEDVDLVTGARSGREVLYHVDPQPLDASARWFASLAAAWDRRLTALKRAAESGAPGQDADDPDDDVASDDVERGGMESGGTASGDAARGQR
jgi:DNA-binding transcriptional ArsR family regulator